MMSEGNFERSSQKTTCGLNSSPQTTTCRSTLYTPPAKVRPWAKFIEVQNFALVVHLSSELGQVSVCCKFSYTCCRSLAKHADVCCEGEMKRMDLVHLSWKFGQLLYLLYLSAACTNIQWTNLVNLLLLCMGNTMDKSCMLVFCIYWGSTVLLLNAFCPQQPLPSLMPSC